MSVYFVKGKDKGWRYDFTLKGIRHTETWFKNQEKSKGGRSKASRRAEKSKDSDSARTNPNRHGLLGAGQ